MATLGRPPGYPKTGGRKKGTINKPRPGVGYVRELMESLGVNTFENQVKIALGKVPCTRCKGKGDATLIVARKPRKTDPEDAPATEQITVTCTHCQGSKLEPVSIGLSAKIYSDLNQYQQPRLSHATIDGELKAPPGETLAEFLSRSEALRAMYPEAKAAALAPRDTTKRLPQSQQ